MPEATAAPLASARRPHPGDLALPLALAVLALGEALVVRQQVADPSLAALATPLLALPLAWRRVHPLAICWCVTLLFAFVAATGTIDADATSGPSLVMLVAVSSAACHAASLRGVLLAAVGMTVLCGLATGMFADGPPAAGDALFGLVFVVGAVVLGRAVHGGVLRRLRLAIELDAARSERAAADQAARHERRRLAHELHDLGSHHLVVATLHAAIAARATAAATTAADPARAAAERARARDAFAIVRTAVTRTADALVALTGADGSSAPERRGPARDGGRPADDARRATGDGLAVALADAEAHGARVEAPAAEVLDAVPEAVALTAVRILQEARTNAAKHAAGGAVAIAVSCDDSRLVVAVGNAAGRATALASGGLGLTGMAERVRLLGGTLHAGPDRGAGGGSAAGWLVRAELPLGAPAAGGGGWLPRELVGGCPAWAALACAALGAWGVAEAVVLDDGARTTARVVAALAAAGAPALLWRRPAALTALAAAALALRGWSATIAPTSSPIVLLTALAAYAVARETRTLRGAVGGIVALVVAMQLSFALAPAPGAASDFGFLPGLVAGAGVAGLLLRLGARDAAALDGEIARARERSAAARAAAVAAERRRLEQELLGLTRRSLAELSALVAQAAGQLGHASRLDVRPDGDCRPLGDVPDASPASATTEREAAQDAALRRTLAAIEATAAAVLADLGRLAAVLRGA